MKEIKQEMKDLQKKMKEFKDQPEKAMAIQKQIMEKTMKQMMQSIKPTLITFLPIILIFTWLRSYYENIGSPDVLFGSLMGYSLKISLNQQRFSSLPSNLFSPEINTLKNPYYFLKLLISFYNFKNYAIMLKTT